MRKIITTDDHPHLFAISRAVHLPQQTMIYALQIVLIWLLTTAVRRGSN